MLCNAVSEDFIKSYREGSKVTIVWRGGNKFGWFLEVAVYAVGGWRGMTLFLEGQDWRGWSCVSRELSKALAFLEATVEALSSGGASVGEFLGKVAGPLSFAEVVRLPSTVPTLGGQPLVQLAEVAWCEVEKILPLGLEQLTVKQAVDCFALERTLSGPLGKDRHADGLKDRSCKGCRKVCSKSKVTKGDAKCECNTLGQEEDGIFRKLLEIFGVWLDLVCRRLTNLGRTSSFGLKRKLSSMGFGWVYKLVIFVLRGVGLQAGSRRIGFMPNIKKAKKMGFAPDYGSDAFSTGLGFEHLGQGVSFCL